jgi:predicted Zn-dependent protease
MRVRQPPSRALQLILLLVVGAGAVALGSYLVQGTGDPEAVWEEAQAALRANQLDRAASALAKLSRMRPPTPADWMLRAQVAISRDRTDDALASLGRVPDPDPLAGQARLLAGQLELRRKRTRPAESYLRAALRIDPRLVQAHRELVFIYGMQLRRGELGRQFRVLSDLTSLTFDNVFHWCLTRNVVWEPREVVREMSAFLAADPGDRWSRLALVESLRQLGRLDEATAAVEPLAADDPDARAARVRLALARGDDAGAESLLKEGPGDHPGLARLRGQLAIAHRDPEAALRASARRTRPSLTIARPSSAWPMR